MARKPKCLLVGRPCPQNGDPQKGDFCPHWQTMQFERREEGNTYRYLRDDCYARFTYAMHEIEIGESKLAAEAVQLDRNEQQKALKAVEETARALGSDQVIDGLVQLGTRALLGRRIASAVEAKNGDTAGDETDGVVGQLPESNPEPSDVTGSEVAAADAAGTSDDH